MTSYYSVHGQPFIDLEPQLPNIGRLSIIADEMARYIANRKTFDILSLNDKNDIHPSYQKEFGFDARDFHPEKLTAPHMDRASKIFYNTFYQPALCLYGFRLRANALNHSYTAAEIEREDCNADTEHAEQVPVTMEFLRELPLKGLGRVTVYHTLPGMSVPAHRDFAEHPGFNSQFIWLNPFRKPFYVLNGQGEKCMVETRAAIFNPNDFHGMDVTWKSAFSIRVDGFWNKSLIQEAGLADYAGGRG